MGCRRRRLWLVISAVTLGVFVTAYGYHFRPVLRTEAWAALVRHAQLGETEGRVFVLAFRPDWLFVEIPDSHQDGYKWFLVRPEARKVSVGYGPQREPYLSFNHDWSGGIPLTDGKVNDGWQVSWSERGVVFENPRFRIKVVRRE
jgi:hypothetical protein